MKEQREILIDINCRCLDEFKLANANLRDDIVNCDSNIREVMNHINNLKELLQAEASRGTLRKRNASLESQIN